MESVAGKVSFSYPHWRSESTENSIKAALFYKFKVYGQ